MVFQDSTNLNSISKYIVDANGDTPYTTIQSALDAANTAGVATAIYVRAGAYTEDLTLYDGIDLWGAIGVADTETCKIIGTHTPPAAGTFTVRNIFLESATDIFNSAVAGTSELIIMDCGVNITNGYTFNVPNWTGSIVAFDVGEIPSTNDGWINNTGGAFVFMTNITMGAGTGNTCIISGDSEFYNVHIQCPITFQSTGTADISGGCWFDETITTAATATVNIANSLIKTGANQAVAHGSANGLSLSNVTVDSANATPIGGAGAGALDIGSIDFVQNSAIAGTVTQTYMRTTDRISPYIVGLTGNFTTIQEALDAATTTGLGETVIVQPGTYTEDLTLYDKIFIRGEIGPLGTAEGTRIVGTHTPPAAGALTINNITLVSATDIFNSAVAGTTTIYINSCIFEVTNGFILNLPNWTGLFNINNCGENSTNNGIINNTGTATVFTNNSQIGAGVGQTFVANGDLRFDLTFIDCPATFTGAGTIAGNFLIAGSTISIGGSITGTIGMGSLIFNTITTANTAQISITDTTFDTGANTAITHGSANGLSLSDVTIDTSNVVTIGGAGAGNLQLGTVTFLDTSAIAGTLTLDRTPVLTTGVVRTTSIEATGTGAGAQEVIEIIPAVAIGGVEWDGIHIDGSALDPTAGSADIHGIHIDLSGVSLANDPEVIGIDIEMPAAFAGDTEKAAAYVRGFGYEVELCSGDHEAAIVARGEIHQDYDATALAAGVSLTAIDSVIDYDGSTGGEIHALNVVATGTGTGTVVALGTHTDVSPVHQHIGAFGAVAQGWKENGGFTDTTVAFNAAGTDVTIFDSDNDYIYMGSNAIFDEIQVILDTPATRNVFPVFEYSIGGPAWTVFTPTDSTSGFTQNGTIAFNSGDLAGWASVVVNGANHFYIRIQRTRNNIGTTPIEDTIQILAATEYYWDETGDTLVKTSYATTFDTNVAAAAVTLTGTTLAADGTDANIPITLTPKGTEAVTIDGLDYPMADGNAGECMVTSGAGVLSLGVLTVPGGGSGAATFTDHGVLVGSGAGAITPLAVGTNGQVLVGSTGADPVFATISNGNNITWTLGAGTLEADLTGTTDHTVQVGNATGSLTSLAAATNGQLLIGSTGADPAVAGLASADASVTITVGAGTIDLAAAGGGVSWSVEAGAGVAAAVDSGYIANRAGGVTFTIPTTAPIGSIIRVCSIQGLSTIAQNAAESIVFGAFTTTVGVGGSLVATNVGDTIEIVCTVADTTWAVLSSVGNWTVN